MIIFQLFFEMKLKTSKFKVFRSINRLVEMINWHQCTQRENYNAGMFAFYWCAPAGKIDNMHWQCMAPSGTRIVPILGLGRQEILENYEIFKNELPCTKKPKICTRCRVTQLKFTYITVLKNLGHCRQCDLSPDKL